MKKKFRKVLAEKCTDFGLTDKALDDLTELAVKDLKDDASDEDIASKADSIVPYAKAMQGETTRKTQKKQSASQSQEEGKGEGENNVPDWFKTYKQENDTRIAALEKENNDLKAEKSAADRAKTIAEKAKKLGIPDFMLEGRVFAEDADIDKELAEFKQKLVNHNLMPKGQANEISTSTEKMTAEEDAWVKSLADKN